MKKLIIVESPTKARTIRKFVGKDYEVESCMGHLRDLPESTKDIPEKYKKLKWAKLGVNVDKDFEPIYCIPSSKQKILKLLKDKSKNSSEIILATDEDREGESISWHLKEILKGKGKTFKRMVFHEITKSAILESLERFRTIDQNLVSAQETRRVLDRLVGYKISPVLWKKVARGLSAGRVQSVAVRLLSEREIKRRNFKRSSFWSLSAELQKGQSQFSAQLNSYQGQSIVQHSDFDRDTGDLKKNSKKLLLDEAQSKKLVASLKKSSFKVADLKTQEVFKKPSPPFITSTLQQEANRKLSLSAKETMSLAQQLYERGFITYMRTDSVFLSQQSLQASKKAIIKYYGKSYASEKPRIYKTKSKGAQEAHEAIRPAGSEFVHPEDSKLSGYLLKVYQMIWQRTLACQAKDCKQERVSVQIQAGKDAVLTSYGMQIQFPGYYKIYEHLDSSETLLPKLKKGDVLKCVQVENKKHETKPPARYTEASLVQTLEKEGVGRPSTYAPTIATIQKRGYAFKDKNALVPTMVGMIVTQFLKENFPDYVDTALTSSMEQALDEIAEGKKNSIQYLNQIYFGNKGLQKQVEKQENKKEDLDSKSLKLPSIKGYTFFAGPWGAYVVRDKKKDSVSLPFNVYVGDLSVKDIEDLFNKKEKGLDALGKDPETKQPIYVLNGKYGPYLQRGDLKGDKADVKKVSIPKQIDSDTIDLETSLKLLALPLSLGEHPKLKKEIKKGIGRFGPYIVCDGDFRSVRDLDVFLNLSLKDAIKILNEEKKKGRQKKVLKKIGVHPETKEEIVLLNGKYGLYIQHKSQKASLPSTVKEDSLDVKKALELLKFKKEGSASKTGSVKKRSNVVKSKKKVSLAGVRKKKSGAAVSKRS